MGYYPPVLDLLHGDHHPLFTILAHGMAAVAVWRVTDIAKKYVRVWENTVSNHFHSD